MVSHHNASEPLPRLIWFQLRYISSSVTTHLGNMPDNFAKAAHVSPDASFEHAGSRCLRKVYGIYSCVEQN